MDGDDLPVGGAAGADYRNQSGVIRHLRVVMRISKLVLHAHNRRQCGCNVPHRGDRGDGRLVRKQPHASQPGGYHTPLQWCQPAWEPMATHRSGKGMRMHKRAVVALILALVLSAGIVTVVAAAGPASVLHLAAVATHPGGSSHSGSGSHPGTGTHQAGSDSGDSGPGTNSDDHGDAVAKAAHTCPHGAHAVHGKCVREVAQKK
jgi:hypothetical protein